MSWLIVKLWAPGKMDLRSVVRVDLSGMVTFTRFVMKRPSFVLPPKRIGILAKSPTLIFWVAARRRKLLLMIGAQIALTLSL